MNSSKTLFEYWAFIYSLGLNNPSSTSRTVYINRGVTDTDQIYYPRAVSTITVMEIAG